MGYSRPDWPSALTRRSVRRGGLNAGQWGRRHGSLSAPAAARHRPSQTAAGRVRCRRRAQAHPKVVSARALSIDPALNTGQTQVYALADAAGLRYRALILLAAFTSLRWAELTALRPSDIDLDARTVKVTRQLHYHQAGHSFGPPKSRAGVRDVDFPDLIVPDLREPLGSLPSSTALVFTTSTGTPLAHSNFRRRVWLPALSVVGLEGVHMHDLRHTGNQLGAQRGRNHRESRGRDGTRRGGGRRDLPALTS